MNIQLKKPGRAYVSLADQLISTAGQQNIAQELDLQSLCHLHPLQSSWWYILHVN